MPDDATRREARPHDKYDRLIHAAKQLPTIAIAVAHPCDAVSLESAVEAAKRGLVRPILVGPAARARPRRRTSNALMHYKFLAAGPSEERCLFRPPLRAPPPMDPESHPDAGQA